MAFGERHTDARLPFVFDRLDDSLPEDDALLQDAARPAAERLPPVVTEVLARLTACPPWRAAELWTQWMPARLLRRTAGQGWAVRGTEGQHQAMRAGVQSAAQRVERRLRAQDFPVADGCAQLWCNAKGSRTQRARLVDWSEPVQRAAGEGGALRHGRTGGGREKSRLPAVRGQIRVLLETARRLLQALAALPAHTAGASV